MALLHDPDARLDSSWDWSAWLSAGETITTATVAPVAGLTISEVAVYGGKPTVWINGGTAGQTYAVTCHIVTTAGREDDRTLKLICQER